MWNGGYWAERYWNGRYWAKLGADVPDDICGDVTAGFVEYSVEANDFAYVSVTAGDEECQ